MLPLIPSILLAGGTKGGFSYGEHAWTYKFAIFVQTLREQSLGSDVVTLGLLLLILLAALVMKKIDGRLGWAALMFGVLSLAMPRHFGGGDYADYRLMAVTLTIGCLAIAWQPPRWLFWIAPALFLYRLGLTTEAWQRQSRELELALKALDYLPEGAKVAGAVVVEPQAWRLNPFEHAPSYATVRRDALVNSHFAIPGVHMLQLKGGGAGFVDPSQRIIRWHGQKIDLTRFKPAKQADYLWYFSRLPPDRLPPGAKVLYATRMSFLARLAKPSRGG
jgi:hypothetical protein